MSIASPTQALAATTFFADLDEAVLEELVADSWIRHYPRGQLLFHEGVRLMEFRVLEAGRVRVSKFSSDGQETVLFVRTPPAVFGELALFDYDPDCAVILIAESDLVMREFRADHVRAVIARHPEACLTMLRNMVRIVKESNGRLFEALALDAPGRLARWLLAHRGPDGTLVLEQSQEELALALGITRVTVNRALRRFERLGWIAVEGRVVAVRDAAALKSMIAI